MNNNEIFEQFWADFKWPDPPVQPEYRLYYNPVTGDPLFYSTDILDGAYIVIPQTEYSKYDHKVFVKHGKLHHTSNELHATKLVHCADGNWNSHTTNVEVLINDNLLGQKWKLTQLI